jgi:hypothetical protein
MILLQSATPRAPARNEITEAGDWQSRRPVSDRGLLEVGVRICEQTDRPTTFPPCNPPAAVV